jgi:hypothetical protein
MSADRYAIEFTDLKGYTHYHVYHTKKTRDNAAERLEKRGHKILGKYYLQRPEDHPSNRPVKVYWD